MGKVAELEWELECAETENADLEHDLMLMEDEKSKLKKQLSSYKGQVTKLKKEIKKQVDIRIDVMNEFSISQLEQTIRIEDLEKEITALNIQLVEADENNQKLQDMNQNLHSVGLRDIQEINKLKDDNKRLADMVKTKDLRIEFLQESILHDTNEIKDLKLIIQTLTKRL